MRKNYIKYFYGSHKAAKRKGLSSEYLVYLKLKLLKDGVLKKGSITSSIQSVSSYSPSSISNYIKKLVAAGFLIPFVVKGKVIGYQVISYKKALKILGVKTRFSGASKNIAKEPRFKRVFAGEILDGKVFKNFIEMTDVYKNSENQKFKQKQKTKRKLEYYKDRLKTNPLAEKKIKELKEDLKSVQTMKGNHFKLSCKKLSRLLGYRSIQQGSLIERKSEVNNFLTIKRHCEVVEKGVSFFEFNHMSGLNNSLYWMFGNVVKNECNDLLFTDTFFSFFESNKQKHTSLSDKIIPNGSKII